MRKASDVLPLVATFYGLDALRLVARPDLFLPSHARWTQDLDRVWDAFVPAFARRLFDYLALACFGEARHAGDRASHCVEGFPVAPGDSRAVAVREAVQYNPRQFLPVLVRLFEEADWESGYGGRSWGRIARAALMYGQVPDVVFIDHCVDLSHNNGLCFDKHEAGLMLYDGGEYVQLLNAKRDKSPQELLAWLAEFVPVCSPLASLSERAVNLGIVDGTPLYTNGSAREAWRELMNAPPVEWGNWEVGDIVHNSSYVTCDNCGEDVPEDGAYYFEGYAYCEECYYDRVGRCDWCGCEVDREDLIWPDVYEGSLCPSCYEKHISPCEVCGAEVWHGRLCPDCAAKEEEEAC